MSACFAASAFGSQQPRLREADLRKVLEFMGYTVADDEFALLWKLVGGSPGFAEALLENANEIAASQGVKRGIEALEGAVRLLPHAQDSGISSVSRGCPLLEQRAAPNPQRRDTLP